ncbi:photosynthetic complex putative assembly protein PuhB [Hyphomicrobium sp. ghe19]|uniref:photosynthetic complex putative assembly protein PuhB n=1 Tax=Hyphomicrobium sp. ghe19 TaxID=2682968 RepID=UPI001366E04D|nr:hypothetical protein HYPP_02331 [Hyphomicrobium sp. ghe19]
MREHDNEPVPGLPEDLPHGERILWQGAPSWSGIAIHALHIRAVAIYLTLIVLWGTTSAIANHQATVDVVVFAFKLTGLALTALAALVFFSRLVARTTLYTITNRRVVMRFGVALPITMNIPLKMVQSAGLHVYRNGSGDIPLAVASERRQSLVVLWPHVRPWRTTKPEPMLRSIPKANEVAELLSSALKAASVRPEIRVRVPRPALVETKAAATSGQTVAA